MSTSDGDQRILADGLVLRPATPADLPSIRELLADRGDDSDAEDLELMVNDPEAGWELCAVVVDGDVVVSTASLMDEQLTIDGVTLPAGQVELVATRRGYEGRGLVRALMNWAHELSAARGHLLQVMLGIPYFYRLFGYEYAIDIPKALLLTGTPPEGFADWDVEPATAPDIPALRILQDQAQASFDVTLPHSAPRRRWLLAQGSSRTYVVRHAGHPVGTARLRVDDSGLLVAEAAAVDQSSSEALLAGLCALHPGSAVTVVDRVGTVPAVTWADRLSPAEPRATQYYLRIADPAALLTALRPVLFGRLAPAQRPDFELVLSTFGKHYRMAVGPEGSGEVLTGGPMQAPYSAGGCGVAPDLLGALLFGPLGMTGLAAIRPDIYPGPDEEVFDALFPPLTADLLTFYLPY